MIELTNIKATDTVGQLRRQINTMQNEIMADQPMIGACSKPSVELYNNATLVSSIPANKIANYLNAVILPSRKNNGCFVLGFTGSIQFSTQANVAAIVDKIAIHINKIKAANERDSYTRFLTPDYLELNNMVMESSYVTYINCQYMHKTASGQVTVPKYVSSIEIDANSPGTLNIIIMFKDDALDFTNGATGFIAF